MPRTITYLQALQEAIDQEMARDPRVFVMGQGVDDHRGMYGTTLGLAERYGAERCFDTPLSEEGMTGVAIGAAMAGMRPIHTHIRMDFVLLAMNQIVNMAAKARYMYGGGASVPLVIRCVVGRSWGQGAQHSQALHSMFMHVPGLRVIAPTTPYDAKGCLTAAIRSDDPVIFMEHRLLHFQKGDVPAEAYELPLGKARVLAEGTDLTLVGISHGVVECLRARDALAKVGISARVIDPVTLSPLDIETITQSVAETGRLLVVDTGWLCCGASAEIVAGVSERLSDRMSLRLKRLGFAPTPCPTSKPLEEQFYPTASQIARSAYTLVTGERTWQPERIDSPEVLEFKGPF